MKKSISILFLMTAVMLCACGEKKETVETKEEKKEETTTNITQNETELKVNPPSTTSEEDKNKANELGMTPGLPASFPADVPQPRNAKTLGSLNSSEGTIVTFESTDKVPDIVAFYKEEMSNNGFKIVEGEDGLISEKGGLINWKKDNRDVGIMLGYDKDKNITSLVITYK